MLIQILGFTLATKQPAMTANALALHLADAKKRGDFSLVLHNFASLIRSQVASVLGNVAGVVPTVWVLYLLIDTLIGAHLVSDPKAIELIEKHSLGSLTPLYAIFTGAILWLSAILAGFFENWSAYRQLTEALGDSSLLQRFLGKERAIHFGVLVREQMTNLLSNVGLAFFLIMTPALISQLGIHIGIRHVTISSGLVTYAALVSDDPLSHAMLGSIVLSCTTIGLLNVFVSFALSFIVASRMCGMTNRDRKKVYRLLFKALIRHPSAFLFPKHSNYLSNKLDSSSYASKKKEDK